jgi:hypothetical protein
MPTSNALVLAVAHQKLCAIYGPVPYSRVWNAAVQGRIPAERVGSRWIVDEQNLPQIAEAIGLAASPIQPLAA